MSLTTPPFASFLSNVKKTPILVPHREIFRNEWRHLKRDGVFEVETCVTWHLVNKLAITHIRPLGYPNAP